MKSIQGVSRKFFYHLILSKAPTPVCHDGLSHPVTLHQSHSLGNMFLTYQRFCKNYCQKHMLLTRHPHEVWRIKAGVFFPSQTIFGNETGGSCENMPPLYSAIKQKQRQLLCNTGHTRAGWSRSDVSNDALHGTCVQFRCHLCHHFHSGDKLEMRTWRETIGDWEEQNQFRSPKGSGAEGHQTLTVALWLWNLLTTTNRQAPWNRVASLTVTPWGSENTNGQDHSVLSTINSCSFFLWSWKIRFFVDLPSHQPFHFSFPPLVPACISNWLCDGPFSGSCHKF